MPERTMLPVTDNQRMKMISKLSHHYGGFRKFEFPLNETLSKMDRDLAQQIIEIEKFPDPDPQAILESLVRYFQELRSWIEKAICNEATATIQVVLGGWIQVCFSQGDKSFRVDINTVCRALKFSVKLFQKIFDRYCVPGMTEGLSLQKVRFQILTNLLPFPLITWDSWEGTSDCIDSTTCLKQDLPINIQDVLLMCEKETAE